MHYRFKTGTLLLAGLALVTAGCRSDPSAARAASGGKGAGIREVKVTKAQQGALPQVVTVTGTLAAEEQVVMGMKVSGRLAELLVDLGSRVSAGQPVARLEPTDFQLRVRQAEAALQQARSRLGLAADGTDDRISPEQTSPVRQARAVLDEARLKRERAVQLFNEKLVPQSELDTAEAAYLVAEGRFQDALDEVRNRQAILAERRSELELARQQLQNSTLLAPFHGAVRERQGTPGQYVAVGQPVVTIVRLHPLRLRLSVPERDAARLRVGQEVRVHIEGDPKDYPGRVARLSPAIEEASRTLSVEAEVPNPSGVLRPGSFARADIVTSADVPVVFVPASSIVNFAGIEKVILVREGRSIEKRVRTGRRVGQQVEITDGVAAGDTVVVEPGNLVGGQPVSVVN